MEKVYVRKCERYTIWEASEPIEVDVEKLRNCEPPFEGETEEELLTYLTENVYNEYEWAENATNQEVYGEDAAYDLTMEDCYEMEVYSDTREKYAQDWIDVGVPNDEWRKMGKFEVKATSVDNS
tara:strand:- start:610 stop:981 length:372 start_codon:yes stop_codon:yes gene_type:complete